MLPFVLSKINNIKMPLTRGSFRNAEVQENRERFLNMPIEEKRKLYSCEENYITIDKIPTWTEYYRNQKLHIRNVKNTSKIRTPEKKYEIDEVINSKIGIWTGDITALEIDAIVNAANKTLMGGGGVDGAIHKSAGKLLKEECATLKGCNTGEAKTTSGYKLPSKYCIHTVGPIGPNSDALRSAYTNSLKQGIENNCKTIAFPCISTGIYGFPNDIAAYDVAELIREFLEKNVNKFDRIIFCLFLEKDIALYEEYLSVFFPVPRLESDKNLEKEKFKSDAEKYLQKLQKNIENNFKFEEKTNNENKNDAVTQKKLTEIKDENAEEKEPENTENIMKEKDQEITDVKNKKD